MTFNDLDDAPEEPARSKKREKKPANPTGLALEDALSGASEAFVEALTCELVVRGFTEPSAFLAPGALTKLASAVMAAAKTDGQAIQALARKTRED